MSNFNNKSITNNGLELLSAAMAGGRLEFTRIVMGSGTYSGDIGMIESLVSQKQSLDIKSITRKGSQVILSATLLQSAITEDFYWKEIGIYAKGDDDVEVLYMYGSATDTSFISKDMLNEKMINVGVLVSNAQNITATIDGSLVYLSRADLDQHNTSDSAHNDIRELISQLELEIENIDVSEAVEAHNVDPTSHADIRELVQSIDLSSVNTHTTSVGESVKTHVTTECSGVVSALQGHVTGEIEGARDNIKSHVTSKETNIVNAVNSARDNVKSHVSTERATIVNAINSKSIISSIQRVTVNFPAWTKEVTFNINSVNVSKTLIIINGILVGYGDSDYQPYVSSFTGSQITLSCPGTASGNVSVEIVTFA